MIWLVRVSGQWSVVRVRVSGQWSGSVIRVTVRVKVRRLVGDLAEQVGHTLGRVVVARDRQHHLDVVEQRGQAVDHRCGRAVVPMRPREHGVARRAHAALPPLPMAKGAALLASLSPRGPSKLVRPRLSRLRPRGPVPLPCAAALCRCPRLPPLLPWLGCTAWGPLGCDLCGVQGFDVLLKRREVPGSRCRCTVHACTVHVRCMCSPRARCSKAAEAHLTLPLALLTYSLTNVLPY